MSILKICPLFSGETHLFSPTEATNRYMNAFSLNGFILLNSLSQNFPTRVQSNNSCFDHILFDCYLSRNDLSHNFYLFDLLADHKSILLNVVADKKPKKHSPIKDVIEIMNDKKILLTKRFDSLNSVDFEHFITKIIRLI